MSLLRFAARTMLASFFVVNGVKALRDPEPLVAATEPIARTALPLAEKSLPPQVAAYLPEDAKGLVRLSGVAQIVGGISLATGIGRRLGAAALAVSMLPQLLASNPFKAEPEDRSAAREQFLRNLALTGGVLLASGRHRGPPGPGVADEGSCRCPESRGAPHQGGAGQGGGPHQGDPRARGQAGGPQGEARRQGRHQDD